MDNTTQVTCKNSPVQITLNVIGGKWKPLIIWLLRDKTMRFNELFRAVLGITQKMLTQQLRQMETDGLIERKIYPEVPPKVEYKLTPHGKSLDPVLQSMCDWGEKHKARNGK